MLFCGRLKKNMQKQTFILYKSIFINQAKAEKHILKYNNSLIIRTNFFVLAKKIIKHFLKKLYLTKK